MTSLNYYEIGQRIRKYRNACNFTQENLAEKVGISTTHMSHIETGNTKLSLPVLVAISEILEVKTDDIIFSEKPTAKTELTEDISETLEKCSTAELSIILDIVNALKISMDKHL